jgi:hemolysin activation/secretion protein
VLGFWLYGWFTFGEAPYLNLPANGWDTYGRGARGYLQGRIRGVNQLYLETEYRRAITRDGLWGAVAFVNGTTTTDPASNTFSRADLGFGIGLRIKFNKHTNTNVTVDYGWGRDDSRGLFLGMSEVF